MTPWRTIIEGALAGLVLLGVLCILVGAHFFLSSHFVRPNSPEWEARNVRGFRWADYGIVLLAVVLVVGWILRAWPS